MRILLCLFMAHLSLATASYKVNYNQCPKQTSDLFIFEILEEFKLNKSLLNVKRSIDNRKLEEKFFLKNYKISYSPVKKVIKINLKCPTPVALIHVYEDLGKKKKYSQLLIEDGSLFNPTYEHALRSENLLKEKLPIVSIEEKILSDKKQKDVAYIIDRLDKDLKSSLVEVLYNKKDISMIFNFRSRTPASVFLGRGFWDEKIIKLNKIFEHYSQSKYAPVKVNLENPRKVVVRF